MLCPVFMPLYGQMAFHCMGGPQCINRVVSWWTLARFPSCSCVRPLPLRFQPDVLRPLRTREAGVVPRGRPVTVSWAVAHPGAGVWGRPGPSHEGCRRQGRPSRSTHSER